MQTTIAVSFTEETMIQLDRIGQVRCKGTDEVVAELIREDYEALHNPQLAKDRRRIWGQVDRSGGPDACWPWIGCIDRRFGYGAVNILKRVTRAHRAIWFLTTGQLLGPEDIVRHKCDNPPCVNPRHLEIGTHADNVNDRLERKGDQKGEHNYGAKLTQAQVDEIRRRANIGEMQKAIAHDFGVSQGSISLIVRGKTWTHSFDVGRHRYYGQRRKLTQSQVDKIRTRAANGETQRILADEFGVHQTCISSIVRYITWRE